MSETVDITYDWIIKRLDESTLYEIDGVEVCLPDSQVEDAPSTSHDGGVITIPVWLATNESLV